MAKVIARIKGGLGNQLFCYAAARRLALANEAELVLDDVTGFVRDVQYKRSYMLDNFSIPARKATPAERMEPLERYRRGLAKWLSRRRPFSERTYMEQEGLEFDPRLLSLKVREQIYLDGYWHSENYFKDCEEALRKDLRITPPSDLENQRIAGQISSGNSVALHVRWFEAPGAPEVLNASVDYYKRAIEFIDGKLGNPRYFLFSDNPAAAKARLSLPEGRVTEVSHNRGDAAACADLWLMSRCSNFIIANSTFSWWGAWLGENRDKIVVAPKSGFANDDAVPEAWHRM